MNVSVFGDVIKRPLGPPLNSTWLVSLQEKAALQGERHVTTEAETGGMWRVASHCRKLQEARKESSPEPAEAAGPADNLILDFQPPEQRQQRSAVLGAGLWHLVTAALGDECANQVPGASLGPVIRGPKSKTMKSPLRSHRPCHGQQGSTSSCPCSHNQ